MSTPPSLAAPCLWLMMAMLWTTSCGDGQNVERVVIDQIEVVAYDENYIEDPFGESGAPDFYAVVSVWNEEYYTSSVVSDQGVGARIDFESLSFQGIEMDREVTITLFDHDDDSLEDFVGEVTFVPRDLLYTEPVRHSLYGGYLQVDLLLQW